MKLDVYSHCALDTISLHDSSFDVPGGAACYCSITAKNMKFDVNLHTKFGPDFPTEIFNDNKIHLIDAITQSPTTKFKINISDSERELYLEQKCDPLFYQETDSDGCIISPIFDEISDNEFHKIKQNSNFTLLDPQGFLRRIDNENHVFLEKTSLDLSDINCIKASPDELHSLTGMSGDEGMKLLQKQGIENIISTNKRDISVLVKDRIYSIQLPKIVLSDTTGVGDIFCAVFCCTMLKEKDFLWALCFAGGAAQYALDCNQLGLDKIPPKAAVESNASYFYNMIKFKQV